MEQETVILWYYNIKPSHHMKTKNLIKQVQQATGISLDFIKTASSKMVEAGLADNRTDALTQMLARS